MPHSQITINRAKVNYLFVFPILDLILEPCSINSKFNFLVNIDNYLGYYKDAFISRARTYTNREPINKHNFSSHNIDPFGCITPISGNELKYNPIFRSKDGNISTIVSSNEHKWLLPVKIVPRLKFNLEGTLTTKHNLRFRCFPLIKIYPFGMMSIQLREFFIFQNGCNTENFVKLVRRINEMGINSGLGKSSKNIATKIYNTVITNIIKNDKASIDSLKPLPYRIVTLYDTNTNLSPTLNKKELYGMIRLQDRGWSNQHIDTNTGKLFNGELEDQFISVHTESTLIHPTKFANNPKYNDYVIRCLESNLTSVIELATLQNQFVRAIRYDTRSSLEEKRQLINTGLFNEFHILGGIHQKIYMYFLNRIGFRDQSKRAYISFGPNLANSEKNTKVTASKKGGSRNVYIMNYIGGRIMGDVFSGIENATIINKSLVRDSFNRVRKEYDEDTSKALVTIAEFIEKSGDPAAGTLFDTFNQELKKPQPEKSKLNKIWDGIVKVLPSVAPIAGAIAPLIR